MTDVKVAFDLSGKVAVVTGAARGIGRAAASALADIAVIDIADPVSATLNYEPATAADLAETARAIEALGRRWPTNWISGILARCERRWSILSGNSVASTFSLPMPTSRRSSLS
ncbi:hypothetical protein WMC41_29640 (plasmid) [Shinella yambaruensis]|uniref:hypothetical protein n=1 Tax=Shinella yambaruensis TaxID=415996 RepID=UPI003D7957BC